MTFNTTSLHSRLARAEARLSAEPKPDPFEDLSYEEIRALVVEILLEKATSYPDHEFSDKEFLDYPEIRRFAKYGRQPWLNNRNHRIYVFAHWLKLSYQREDLIAHPDIERLRDVFSRAYYDGEPLSREQINFAIETLAKVKLDAEQPWLEHYLAHVAGSLNEKD